MNKFASYFFIGFFIIITGVVVTNLIIDPYAVTPFSLIDRAHKEMPMRLTKAMDVIRKKPDAILLGSSRVLCGCSLAEFNACLDMKSYNLALSGTNFEELFAYFQHALHHQKNLKVVVVGLDLFSFNANHTWYPDFDADLLANDRFPWKSYWKSLGTMHAFRASLKTIYSLYRRTPHHFVDTNGDVPISALLECKNRFKSVEDFDRNILQGYFANPSVYGNFCLSEKSISLFHRMAAICKERGIELKVFISPCRSLYWHTIYLKGLWIDLENLKRALLKSVPIWDISGCNALTEETITRYPSASYFDVSHFLPHIGRKILQTLLLNEKIPFGILVNQENCEEALSFLHEEQMKWPARHPQETAFLNDAMPPP